MIADRPPTCEQSLCVCTSTYISTKLWRVCVGRCNLCVCYLLERLFLKSTYYSLGCMQLQNRYGKSLLGWRLLYQHLHKETFQVPFKCDNCTGTQRAGVCNYIYYLLKLCSYIKIYQFKLSKKNSYQIIGQKLILNHYTFNYHLKS